MKQLLLRWCEWIRVLYREIVYTTCSIHRPVAVEGTGGTGAHTPAALQTFPERQIVRLYLQCGEDFGEEYEGAVARRDDTPVEASAPYAGTQCEGAFMAL